MRLVLDTSCVRGTPRKALAALKARGFEIHVSGLALSELAVHFAHDDPDVKEMEKLRARMVFIAALFDGPVRFAPTHGALVDKLGGTMVGIDPLPFMPWLASARATWDELVAGIAIGTTPLSFSKPTAEYVEETGDDFLATMESAAALGQPTAGDLEMTDVLRRLAPPVIEHIRLPQSMSSAERFDGYTRLLVRRVTQAHARSRGDLRRAQANDAIDTNLLHHLADGLLIVTQDYGFVEEVDATRSPQAPWVRTVGELLLGRRPAGLPFGYGARVAARKHRMRRRERLARFDAEGFASVPD
jgi:hypothetical protein